MKRFTTLTAAVVMLFSVLALAPAARTTPAPASIEKFLSYSFAYELVSARKADRIAWLENQEGRRNIWTAAAPDFKPVRLTDFSADDGNDLSALRLSDDGSTLVFVRGHDPNREGWTANPSHLPDGGEQALWAVKVRDRKPFRLTTAAGADPRLSPDGKTVIWARDGQVYGAAVKPAAGKDMGKAGEEPQPFFRTWGKNSDLSWSPDGRRIVFVSDRTDHSFIGVYEAATRKITYLAPSVDKDSNPAWSGDGKKIAFIRRPGSSFGQITAAAQAQGVPGMPARPAAPTPPPAAPPDKPGQAQAAPPAAGPQTASGPGFHFARFEDGRVLTFWIADVETGAAERVWQEPLDDQSWRPIRSLLWAGESLIFPVERNNWNHYYAVPISGGVDAAPVDLTPGEGEAEFIGLSAAGQTLFYTGNAGDLDRRHLWAAPTKGGAAMQLTRGEGIETEAAPLASGARVAVFAAGAKRPRGVALVPAQGGEPRMITGLPPDYPAEIQVVPEPVILTAEDGIQSHAQVFVPKDIPAGEKRPALLFAHGGPVRQMLLGYHYMYFYHMAYAMNQYFASRGYVVISMNFRSGIGYGRAFRAAAGRGATGSSEYGDILAAAKYLQSRPDVDPSRIGIWGLSYGGLLTALGLSRNSDIFKAGVDIAGVHLWGNSLDVNSTAFKASTIATVDQWTSPVLLIHGDDDRNVPFSQTTGLVQLLRARKIPHELIVFPDEVHDFLVHRKWLRVFHAAEDFFQRKLAK